MQKSDKISLCDTSWVQWIDRWHYSNIYCACVLCSVVNTRVERIPLPCHAEFGTVLLIYSECVTYLQSKNENHWKFCSMLNCYLFVEWLVYLRHPKCPEYDLDYIQNLNKSFVTYHLPIAQISQNLFTTFWVQLFELDHKQRDVWIQSECTCECRQFWCRVLERWHKRAAHQRHRSTPEHDETYRDHEPVNKHHQLNYQCLHHHHHHSHLHRHHPLFFFLISSSSIINHHTQTPI